MILSNSWKDRHRTPLLVTLLACSVWFGLLSTVNGKCSVVLTVDGRASDFSFQGEAKDLPFIGNVSLGPKYPNQEIGLLGGVVLRSSRDCDVSDKDVAKFIKGGKLRADGGPLRLYPSAVAVSLTGGLADVSFQNLDLTLETNKFVIQDSGNFSANFNLTIVNGTAEFSSSLPGIEAGSGVVAGYSSLATLEGAFSAKDGELKMDLPEANFTFNIEFETGFDELPLLKAELQLDGRISASGVAGCDLKCGENGRCGVSENGVEFCECACGWGGEQCEYESGFCPEYGEVQTIVTTPTPLRSSEQPEQNVASDELEQQCADLYSARECKDDRSTFDPGAGACVCKEGWEGKDCDMCTGNNVCAAYINDGSSCKTDFLYDVKSREKVYECNLSDTTLNELIGDVLKLKCNTTGPDPPELGDAGFLFGLQSPEAGTENGIGNSPFCEMDFVYLGKNPVNCTGWNCQFAPGSTEFTCPDTECSCQGDGCEAVNGFVNGIEGVEMECSDASGRCDLMLGGIKFTVSAPCKPRECWDPSGPDILTAALTKEAWEPNWDVMVISIPPVFVILVALCVCVPGLCVREVRKFKSTVPVVVRKSSHVGISEVTFNNLAVSVPLFGDDTEKFAPRSNSDQSNADDPEEPGLPRRPSFESFNLSGLDDSLLNLLDNRKNYKSILHGISGKLKRGDLVGVMGPSGSGKTTLLSIISNMGIDGAKHRNLRGEILLDGRRQGSWMKRMVAFVPQEDKLLPTLTVRESFMYSAILRLPDAGMPFIHRRMDEVVQELGLDGVANALVGGVRSIRGISGGERRRVTIGMELITDPSIIILDEPTSGLDSYTALNLMHTLKNVSSAGRLVVLSVHQPAPAMYTLLDQVLLLAKGFQVYFGSPKDAQEYFSRHGFDCPESMPIAEYLLQAVSHPHTLVPLLNSIQDNKVKGQLEEVVLKSESDNGSSTQKQGGSREGLPPAQRKLRSFQVLAWRGFVDIVRNPALLLSHLVSAIAIGLMIGVTFWQAGLDITGTQNRLGALFFLLAFMAFSSLTTIDLLHAERGIAVREIQGGYYTPAVYVGAKLLLDAVLLRIIPAILISVPLYWMMGMQNDLGKYMIYTLCVCTFNLVVGALSMVFTILSPTAGTASLVINTFLLITLLLMGHLVHIPSIPRVVRWLHYLSPFSYTFQALAVNEMSGLKLTFTVPGFTSVDGIDGGIFLSTLGVVGFSLRKNLWVLVIFYAVASLTVFLAMCLTLWRLKTSGIRRHAAATLKKRLSGRPNKAVQSTSRLLKSVRKKLSMSGDMAEERNNTG